MDKFGDLGTRVTSGVVLAVVGIGAVWLGGLVFLVLAAVAAGLMIWELSRLVDRDVPNLRSGALGVVAAAAVLRIGFDQGPLALTALMIAPVVGMVVLRRDRALFLVYATAILFAVAFLFRLRIEGGLLPTALLILVVIASDVFGYFCGRLIGGPKILPKISPKKTWSGTVGGWIGAALVAVVFGLVTAWQPSLKLALLAVATAMASQIGDVVESAVKRHADVKDASNLIPGHGGVLDRFDAMIGASLFLLVVTIVAPWIGAQ
jgi:phosphatidate cytidylyltransferase